MVRSKIDWKVSNSCGDGADGSSGNCSGIAVTIHGLKIGRSHRLYRKMARSPRPDRATVAKVYPPRIAVAAARAASRALARARVEHLTSPDGHWLTIAEWQPYRDGQRLECSPASLTPGLATVQLPPLDPVDNPLTTAIIGLVGNEDKYDYSNDGAAFFLD
jgi:hypothetical protein